jgi:hypothetical protein
LASGHVADTVLDMFWIRGGYVADTDNSLSVPKRDLGCQHARNERREYLYGKRGISAMEFIPISSFKKSIRLCVTGIVGVHKIIQAIRSIV